MAVAPLDADATARAAQMRHPADRARHLSARMLAQGVLRQWAGTTADLSHPRWRRPQVHGAPLWLSIAHAAGHVAVAIATCPVGIDFEPVAHPHAAATEAAMVGLHTLERDGLVRQYPPTRRVMALEIWVAKEALLKGTGHGLTVDPAQIHLEEGPAGWRIADQPDAIAHTHDWLLRGVVAPAGYRAAVALADATIEPVSRYANHPGRPEISRPMDQSPAPGGRRYG